VAYLGTTGSIVTNDLAYQELQAYTLTRGDAEFLHQYVVDTWTAQQATESTKPIALTFALMGLFLHTERGWTGREVQRGHMDLARQKQEWPALHLPAARGAMRPEDVMKAPAGEARDAAIRAWCACVWQTYAGENRETLEAWLKARGIRTRRA
jgi:hypothetical protein